jgi:predicted Zn-ribbon and HTH transcriptional regulator
MKSLGDPKYDQIINTVLDGFLNKLPAMTKEITEGRGFSKSQIRALMSGRHGEVGMREFAGIPITGATRQQNIDRLTVVNAEDEQALALEYSGEPMTKDDKPADNVARFIAKMHEGLPDKPISTALPKAPCNSCGYKFEAILNECPNCQTERN